MSRTTALASDKPPFIRALRILNIIFPWKLYAPVIAISIYLHYEGVVEGNALLINLALLTIFLPLCIIVHEAGHLLFCKLAGGIPKRMTLGRGHEVDRFMLGSIKVVVNNVFVAGYALGIFGKGQNTKLRNFIFVLGGPLTNLVIGGIAYWLVSFDLKSIFDLNLASVLTCIVVVNGYLLLIALTPSSVRKDGMAFPTDGLRMLQLIFAKMKNDPLDDYTYEVIEAFEAYEEKDYARAIELYEKLAEISPDNFAIPISLSAFYGKVGRFDDAKNKLQKWYDELDPKKPKPQDALILNNMAWYNLLSENYKEARAQASRAYELDKRTKVIAGTYGATLAETGETDRAEYYLEKNCDFRYVNETTLIASLYLAWIMHLDAKPKHSKKYLKFVQDNLDVLEMDDMVLYDRIVKRLGADEKGSSEGD